MNAIVQSVRVQDTFFFLFLCPADPTKIIATPVSCVTPSVDPISIFLFSISSLLIYFPLCRLPAGPVYMLLAAACCCHRNHHYTPRAGKTGGQIFEQRGLRGFQHGIWDERDYHSGPLQLGEFSRDLRSKFSSTKMYKIRRHTP